MDYDQTFSPDPASAGAARRFVRDRVAAHGLATDDPELVVAELMSNVVQHAKTPITVRVQVGQRLRIEVHDGNSIIPAMKDAAEDAESGRGLYIIDAIATEWGIEATTSGKFVWVETAREEV